MRPLRIHLLPVLAAAAAAAAAATSASAYSALITVEASGYGDIEYGYGYSTLAYLHDDVMPKTSYSTTLSQPLTASRDPSFDSGASGSYFVSGNAAYEATIEPGALHLQSRSFASAETTTQLVDPFLRSIVRGALETSFTDDFVVTLANVPKGTPFLMSVPVQIDGVIGTSFLGANLPPGIDAAANAKGFWGIDLKYAGAPPAGIPGNVTNSYQDGSSPLLWVDKNGTYDDVSQRLLNRSLVFFYGISGEQAQLTMFFNLESMAAATICRGCGTALFGYVVDPVAIDAGVNLAFNNTFKWGGISSVQLLDGTPVDLSTVDVQSSSGFDYRHAFVSAVPEPTSAVLLAAGLGAMGALGVRSRRR